MKLSLELNREECLMCDDVDCQICCTHEEKDHGICMSCDKDCNDGSDIDDAYERIRGM